MCLGPDFFDGRDALIQEREARGDIELVNFIKPRHVSIGRLYQWGLLKDDREFLTTADFFVHEITGEGRAYLEEDAFQLIFVRQDRARDFNAFINRARRRRRGASQG